MLRRTKADEDRLNPAVELLRRGPNAWNSERGALGREPYMAGMSFMDVFSSDPYDLPSLYGYDFSDCFLKSSELRNAWFVDCNFDGADIGRSDMVDAGFEQCTFRGARLRSSVLSRAMFADCSFDWASLAYSAARTTELSRCSFVGADLSHMSLVQADLTGSSLIDAYVYGVSAWEVTTEQTVQRGLIATRNEAREWYGTSHEDGFLGPSKGPVVTVGSLEVAQFVNLLLHNPKVRDVIDTITARVVLILGRFTAERKAVLDRLRDDLGGLGFVPVLFDFEGPKSRDVTETVSTLAHLARFVVADLTEPRSVPQELATVVPHLPSVPVQPIIAAGHRPYGMFEHFERYSWVRPLLVYGEGEVPTLSERIVESVMDQGVSPSDAFSQNSD